MKFLISLLISITSVALVTFQARSHFETREVILLRQKIQLIEHNTVRNVLVEQDVMRQTLIIERALKDIDDIRKKEPMQLPNDEKIISKIVQNLKSFQTKTYAQFTKFNIANDQYREMP